MTARARLRVAARHVWDLSAEPLRVFRKLVGPVMSQQTVSEALHLLEPMRQPFLTGTRDRQPPDIDDLRAAETIRACGMYALGLTARGTYKSAFRDAVAQVYSLDEPEHLPGDPALKAALIALHIKIRIARTALTILEDGKTKPTA